MKKNKVLRTAALLLACCMFSLCTITGTMARWVTDLAGDSQTIVRAGRFEIQVWDSTLGESGESGKSGDWVTLTSGALGTPVSINLFDKLYQEDVSEPHDGNVLGGENANVIAPGTGGKFKVRVLNASEVDVDVLISVDKNEITGTDIPIQWKDGSTFSTDFPTGANAGFTLDYGKEDEIEFLWMWAIDPTPLERTNADDTALGAYTGSSAPKYIVPLTISAAQILPGEDSVFDTTP